MRLDRFLFVICLLVTFPSQSKDAEGNFAIKGVGVLSCQQFINAASKDLPALQQYAGYVAGYVSAYNEHQNNTFDLLPWQQLDTVMLLLLQSCKQTPNSSLGGAVSRVSHFFASKALDKESKKVAIQGNGQSVYLYPEVITLLKEALSIKGYDTTDLWSAMQKYQLDNKLVGKTPFDQLIIMKLLYSA